MMPTNDPWVPPVKSYGLLKLTLNLPADLSVVAVEAIEVLPQGEVRLLHTKTYVQQIPVRTPSRAFCPTLDSIELVS